MLKIGEFAKLFSVSIKTIRHYEEKGILTPSSVDTYTGYRYYDEVNVEEMTKILILKNLGLSLNEIKNFEFDKTVINSKIESYKSKIDELSKNIDALSHLSEGEKTMETLKPFLNDQKAIGKWKLLGISKTKEEALKHNYQKDDFKIGELYLMPDGQEYWVIHWTKGYIFIKDKPCPYEIDGKFMYIIISDMYGQEQKIATYEKIDENVYTIDVIKIKDEINIPFVEDDDLIGFYQSIDFISKKEAFDPDEKKENLTLKKIIVTPDHEVHVVFNTDFSKEAKYTKGFIINLCCQDTLSAYEILHENNEDYLIVEWKSGDYIYGKMINGYYVLKKIH